MLNNRWVHQDGNLYSYEHDPMLGWLLVREGVGIPTEADRKDEFSLGTHVGETLTYIYNGELKTAFRQGGWRCPQSVRIYATGQIKATHVAEEVAWVRKNIDSYAC